MNRAESVHNRLSTFRARVVGSRCLTNSEDTALVLTYIDMLAQIVQTLVKPPSEDEFLEEFASHAEGTD